SRIVCASLLRKEEGDDLSCRDVVAEDAVGRIQHGERGAADRVTVGERASDETRAARGALRDRHDDHVGIERSYKLDAHEFQTEAALRERLDGFDGGFRAEAQVTDGARLSFRLADEAFAVVL